MTKLIQHHTKYQEIHGIDEIKMMTRREHRLLHDKLRAEGKCNIPPIELKKISIKAYHRTEKYRKYTQEFNKTAKSKKIHSDYKLKSAEHLVFCDTVLPNVILWEDYTYNRITGTISISSYFTGNHGLKLAEVFV